MAPAGINQVSKVGEENGLDVTGISSAIEADAKALASLGQLDDIKRGLS